MPDEQQFVPRMRPRIAAPRSPYFCISAISGFSRSINEPIGIHHLRLFLEHAVYAQLLVLVIFLRNFTRPSNQIKLQCQRQQQINRRTR